MRTGHLFAGIGGGILADLILGHTPVFAVERERYCCEILRKFPDLHVSEGDIREWDPSPWVGRVDCISAGFPCQDISVAGSGAGLEGARSGLFFEVMRAVDVIRPAFVFLENSPAIRTRGRRTVIAELVARGYSWRDGVYRASDLGAPHRRDRWFLLAADAASEGHKRGRIKREQTEEDRGGQRKFTRSDETPVWLPIVPDVGGVAHGVPDWTHIKGASIRALGNAQVPIQAAYAMADLMRGE